MGTIKIKNKTTLTDFSALFRVGLYLSGNVEDAVEGGFTLEVGTKFTGETIIVIREEPAGTVIPADSR